LHPCSAIIPINPNKRSTGNCWKAAPNNNNKQQLLLLLQSVWRKCDTKSFNLKKFGDFFFAQKIQIFVKKSKFFNKNIFEVENLHKFK
jgi:hypothetical protein